MKILANELDLEIMEEYWCILREVWQELNEEYGYLPLEVWFRSTELRDKWLEKVGRN